MSEISSPSSGGPCGKPKALYFNPLTRKHQDFAIPEKILYHIAKNPTNANVFQKMVESCKYFFPINPVVVVPQLLYYESGWYACDEYGKPCFEMDDAKPKNFKVWLNHKLVNYGGSILPLIPGIYKNDATFVELRHDTQSITFKEFLFATSNAEELLLYSETVKDENGEVVQFETIVENLPKLKSLSYDSCYDESDFTTNTASALMEIEHFKNISQIKLCDVPESLNVETMLNFITENKHIRFHLFYRRQISDAYKKLVREYSNRLEKESGHRSKIRFRGMIDDGFWVNFDEDSNFLWNSEN